MKRFLLVFFLFLSACKNSIHLEKRTVANNTEPYTISVVDPMGPDDFYHRLFDSLEKHISMHNTDGFSTISKDEEKKNSFLGWLQEQFDDNNSGIGLKASSKLDRDRTSEEYKILNPGSSSTDKFSFTIQFRVDSIPIEFLYPSEWKKAVALHNYDTFFEKELTKFQTGGRQIRTNSGIKDTLFVYSYNLPVDITLNYFSGEKKQYYRTMFTIPTDAAVYHQLKFK